MKKTVIALSLGTMLLTGGNAKATDFDSLPIKEKTQIMKKQYKIYERSGSFKKGSRYKIIYKGDYIIKIKKIK